MDEMRLIDAYKLKSLIEDFPEWMKFDKDRVIKTIDNAPTVEQPTGEWVFNSDNIMFGNPYGSYKCTNCYSWTGWITHFCPNCGAKMKGGEGNEAD